MMEAFISLRGFVFQVRLMLLETHDVGALTSLSGIVQVRLALLETHAVGALISTQRNCLRIRLALLVPSTRLGCGGRNRNLVSPLNLRPLIHRGREVRVELVHRLPSDCEVRQLLHALRYPFCKPGNLVQSLPHVSLCVIELRFKAFRRFVSFVVLESEVGYSRLVLEVFLHRIVKHISRGHPREW